MKDLPELDIAELLDSEEVMAGYLSEILASGDSALIMSALGDIARAKGMSAIAKETGLNRESLYKTFRPGTEPKFDTVLKIMSALKLNLAASPQANMTDTGHSVFTRVPIKSNWRGNFCLKSE